MNTFRDAQMALQTIPGWDAERVTFEALHGGLTNRNYKVTYEGSSYVLRLDSKHSPLFQLDRNNELKVASSAHAAGIAPAIVFANPAAGILLREFLPGFAWRRDDLQSADNLAALARLLREVHALPLSGKPVNLADTAIMYLGHIADSRAASSFASRCLEIVRNIPLPDDVVCCHNDIVAGNVIETPALKIIDWEYAGDGDPMFDLASAIGFHNLEQKEAEVLLDAYCGGASSEWRERLATQRRAYDAIQWLWLATRQTVSPSPEQSRRLAELQRRIS